MKKSAVRALAVLLSVLFVFGSFGVSAFAGDDELRMDVRIAALKNEGGEWVEAKTAAPGENIKIRVYFTTGFKCGAAMDLPFVYDSSFFSDSYGSNATLTLGDEFTASPYNYSARVTSGAAGYEAQLVSDGQITEAEAQRYTVLHTIVFASGNTPSTISGENWFCEYDLTVREDAEGTGYFKVLLSTVGCAGNLFGVFSITNDMGYDMQYWGEGWNPALNMSISNAAVSVKTQDSPDKVNITFDSTDGAFSDGKTELSGEYAFGEAVSAPAAPANDEAVFLGWYDSEDKDKALVDFSEAAAVKDRCYKAKWSYAESYEASFTANGSTVKTYTPYGEAVIVPRTPEMAGYDFMGWSPKVPEKMPAKALSFTAVFEPKTFKVDIILNDEKIGETSYTYGDKELDLSGYTVPEKEGYNGEWQYELTANGAEVNAVYTPKTFTVDIIANGEKIGETSYTYGDKELENLPPVPEKEGYNGEWQYELTANGAEVNAVYTPKTFTVDIIADGKKIGETSYTYGDRELKDLPPVPEKEGFTGRWEYELTANGAVVNAVYEAIAAKISIHKMSMFNNQTVKYKSTITFYADVENGNGVEWSVSGASYSVNADGSCTVKQAKNDFTVSCKTVNAAGETVKSETETVKVKHGFFDKLIAFFKLLFNKNAYTYYQK